jgi:5,10-methylenetetrahydromethanopterin reductase
VIPVDVGLLPQEPVRESAELAAEAERLGFGGVWVADSHQVFRDAWATLALCAERTRTIRLATGVTNPVTRSPAALAGAIATVDELSGGRAVLGIGVGESAVRNAGLAPARLGELEEAVAQIRGLLDGGLSWPARRVPVVVGASGPRALALAGRIGDGALVQIGARPELVRWALERLGADRPPVHLRLACAVGDRAREEVAPYAAAAANTIVRAVPADALPPDLRDDLRELRERYDYARHVGAAPPHAEALTDRVLDAVAVVGDAGEVASRLRSLARLVETLVIPVVGPDKRAVLHRLAAACA